MFQVAGFPPNLVKCFYSSLWQERLGNISIEYEEHDHENASNNSNNKRMKIESPSQLDQSGQIFDPILALVMDIPNILKS